MLLDIFITVPSLLMTTMAWYIHVGLALICLIVLFAIAIGAISIYRLREDKTFVPHRPRRKLVPGV
jgi:hypothetical protein